MSKYDLTLKKEVKRRFARKVMGRISKSNKVFKWNVERNGRIRLIQLKKEHKSIERDTDLAPVLFFILSGKKNIAEYNLND